MELSYGITQNWYTFHISHEAFHLRTNKLLLLLLQNLRGNEMLKVVLGGYHRFFFGVKVKTVKLIGGRRYLAVRSGLNARIYS